MTVKPITLNGGQLRQLQAAECLQLMACTTANASLNFPHGTAPTSPVNGDMWTTTAGLYARINGSTVGPLGSSAVTSVFGRTGAVVATSGDYSFSLISGNLTLSQFPSIADLTVLGNVSGGSTVPTALSKTQLTTLVNTFSSSISGAAPASGGGTSNFLRADGTWTTPPGSATSPGGSSGQVQYNNAGAFGGFTIGGDATLNTATGALTLAASGASASTYGDSTHTLQVTVDAKGRITSISQVAVSTGSAPNGMLPLTTGESPGPYGIADGRGQFIGVPL